MNTPNISYLVTDVLVIGSGSSGASAAQQAASKGVRVLLASKDPITCSDSKISEGIVTVRGSGTQSDSVQNLANNMRFQGDNLASKDITQKFSEASQAGYQWLQSQGLKPGQMQPDGSPVAMDLPMGGHNCARSVEHVNNGLDYGHACWNAITQSGVDYLEDTWALDCFMQQQGSCSTVTGMLLWHALSGDFISVSCSQVILACGGASTLYAPHSDTMRGNTGDGYAIALRAGAALVDMEQVQFIPFAVATPGNDEGLILGEPVSAGILGKITDKQGNTIISEVMTRTRAECCAAMATAIANGMGTVNEGCYLDLTANAQGQSGKLFQQLLKEKVPGLLQTARRVLGHDAANMKVPWEVKPSAHYFMGGVYCNSNGQALNPQHQVIKGLYACGQAMGGVHGSNRLGSTSLAEAVIFGGIAGRHAASQCQSEAKPDPEHNEAQTQKLIAQYTRTSATDNRSAKDNSGSSPIQLLLQLQQQAWQNIGPARKQQTMTRFASWLESFNQQLKNTDTGADWQWNQLFIDKIEALNLTLCARCIVHSALFRRDSMGAHFRTDSSGHKAKNYSVLAHLSQQSVLISTRSLEAVNPLASLQNRLRIKARQWLFKIIGKLPEGLKDKVLCKIYSKAMRQPVPVGRDKLTAPPSTS